MNKEIDFDELGACFEMLEIEIRELDDFKNCFNDLNLYIEDKVNFYNSHDSVLNEFEKGQLYVYSEMLVNLYKLKNKL